MQDTIKNICNAIQTEAEAVKGYTDKITYPALDRNNVGVLATFIRNQLDAVEHLQNLTVELTKLVSEDIKLAELIGGGENEQS